MAGTVTREQAEGYWDKYNKDGNNELTVEEVKQCLQEVYDTVDEEDIQGKYAFFGQKEPKSMKKEEFISGMVRADKCAFLKKAFNDMDTDGSKSLSKEELETGLDSIGINGEQASIILDELTFDANGQFDIDEFLEVVAFSEVYQQMYEN